MGRMGSKLKTDERLVFRIGRWRLTDIGFERPSPKTGIISRYVLEFQNGSGGWRTIRKMRNLDLVEFLTDIFESNELTWNPPKKR